MHSDIVEGQRLANMYDAFFERAAGATTTGAASPDRYELRPAIREYGV